MNIDFDKISRIAEELNLLNLITIDINIKMYSNNLQYQLNINYIPGGIAIKTLLFDEDAQEDLIKELHKMAQLVKISREFKKD